VIIGTAGHIDHGKTSLVKALTGVDADRLKEEKERGITVDLGFAYKPGANGDVLGFVDVPGHEKLVRNMLAGATGIDHVMLVVAADDGPMPQTREHVAILSLLGLSQGVVALTKSDLVTPERLAQATAEVQALLAPTALATAPILPVSNVTGQGIDALQAHLDRAQWQGQATRSQGHFRLAVDRSFSLAGIGTVVTGTAVAGRVAVGDQLLLSPSGRSVRVRGIHAQNAQASEGIAGQRLAINVSGVDKGDIQRGHWLVGESAHAPTERLDVRLHLLASEARALAHWTPLHLHLGAEDVGARVVMLEGEPLKPGGHALVQLQLDRPIGALRGDRFIVRDQSALRTMGGGQVIDIFAPATQRRKTQRAVARGLLTALELATPAQALTAMLALEPANGIHMDQFCVLWNLLPNEKEALTSSVAHRLLQADKSGGAAGARLAFAPAHMDRLSALVTQHLSAHHQRAPDSPGVAADALHRAIVHKPSSDVFALLLRELVQGGVLRRAGPHLALAGHEVKLQAAEQAVWERIKPWLDAGGIHPPKLSDMLERDRNLRKDQVLRVLERLARMGKVHAVGAEYFIQTQHVLALALQSQALAERDPNKRLNVKELRDATGLSRHLSVPLVEFFDAIGFTKRDPVGRHIRRDARKMFGGES
jgi:selenocysteine-specific elongation factor